MLLYDRYHSYLFGNLISLILFLYINNHNLLFKVFQFDNFVFAEFDDT